MTHVHTTRDFIPRPEKQAVVEKLNQGFRAGGSFFLTDFTGLTVQQVTELRRQFRAQQIRYLVAKNTLIRLAAMQNSIVGIEQYLAGPTGVVFGGDDPALVARILQDFIKKIEKPRVKAFWVEGKLFDSKQLPQVASLPGKQELRAELIRTLNSPLAGFVGTIENLLRSIVLTIDAMAKKKEIT